MWQWLSQKLVPNKTEEAKLVFLFLQQKQEHYTVGSELVRFPNSCGSQECRRTWQDMSWIPLGQNHKFNRKLVSRAPLNQFACRQILWNCKNLWPPASQCHANFSIRRSISDKCRCTQAWTRNFSLKKCQITFLWIEYDMSKNEEKK